MNSNVFFLTKAMSFALDFTKDCSSPFSMTVALQAFFCLAKARYAMGSHRIGTSQFDAHMLATTLLSLEPGLDGPQYSVLHLSESKAADSTRLDTVAAGHGNKQEGEDMDINLSDSN